MHFPLPTRNEDGFSLLEIITVILIMGVLAGIAVPVFSSIRGTGHDLMVSDHVKIFDGKVQSWKVSDPNSEVEPSLAYDYEAPEGVHIQIAPNPATEDIGDYLITGWHDNGFKYTQDKPLVKDSNDSQWIVKKYAT